MVSKSNYNHTNFQVNIWKNAKVTGKQTLLTDFNTLHVYYDWLLILYTYKNTFVIISKLPRSDLSRPKLNKKFRNYHPGQTPKFQLKP